MFFLIIVTCVESLSYVRCVENVKSNESNPYSYQRSLDIHRGSIVFPSKGRRITIEGVS